MTDLILIDRVDAVATVTLNRHAHLNALVKPMWIALRDGLRALDADARVRCIVLRGDGTAFCAGADIAEFETERASSAASHAYGALMDETVAAMIGCRHPIVASIDGPCVGAGLVLAACCDMRLATTRSRFGAPVSRIGINMPLPEFAVLARLVGHRVALEIVLEARVMGAEEALAKGVVNRVVADAKLAEETQTLAARIVAGAPLANQTHKRMAWRLAEPTPLSHDEIERSYDCFDSADCREGYHAFLEKRKPAFEGR